MSIKSQLLKRILEGCILAITSKYEVYVYELAIKRQGKGLKVVKIQNIRSY